MVYNISFEVASTFFLAILYVYIRLQYSNKSQVNKEFKKLTLCMLASNVLDVVSAITISYGSQLPRWVNWLTNTVFFVSTAYMGYHFTTYSRACVHRKELEGATDKAGGKVKKEKIDIFNKGLMILYIGFLCINLFTGLIFDIGENGEYIHGPLYYAVYALSYYFILCGMFIMFSNYRKFEKKQMFSVFLYTVIISIGPVLQMLFFSNVLLGVFTCALGLVMMLFSMETPDYYKLVKAMEQLEIAQKEAEEANQTKTRFLANMSHEVRTPANAILSYNGMILNEATSENILEYATNVQSAGRTLVAMFNDILDFTNMNTSEFSLNREPYKTVSILQDIITYTLIDAKKKNISLHVDVDEMLPLELSGDMLRLMQVINNLVSNAIKYTEEGCVSIRAKWMATDASTGILKIEVEDTGVGIKEEDLSQIHNRFYGRDKEREQYTQGMGLGLPIVTKLLELMGSRLEVQSELGKGSTFSFEVQQSIVDNTPIGTVPWGKPTGHEANYGIDGSMQVDATIQEYHMKSEEQQKFSYKKSEILGVDDNAMNLRMAKRMLEKHYKVYVAKNGKEIFVSLEKHLPDLILLDIHMPDINGFEVIKRLQAEERYKDIPVIFLTADGDINVEVRGFEEGAFDFIKKPLVEDVILHRVSRILELKHLQTNLKQEVEKQTKTANERHEKVERISLQTMETLASTIDAKDKYTNGHSIRVAEYSKELARRLGKSEKEQEDIFYAGLLHDIGKIGIPDEIINKTSRLTDEEYTIIKTHPSIGADILKNISELPMIAVGAHWHHERFDGRGYPDQLKEFEIPEVARIIGVADAYDAMTSNRSYRNIMPQSKARDEINKGKGTQFDPIVADKMLEMIDADTEYRMQEHKNSDDI